MQKESTRTAVLFFTRSAEVEADFKQFTSGGQNTKNVQIAASLIEHTREQISDAGLPCFQINEQDQVGSTFGERFANAFQSVFEKGFDHVIAVGNDTPLLKSKHITEAAKRLRSGDVNVILGPSNDGGTWLMGYSREAFDATAFEQLPWNSDRLFESVLQQSKEIGSVDLLEVLSDIDDPSSLQTFVCTVHETLSVQRLIKRIKSILSTKSSAPRYEDLFLVFAPAHQKILLRAPPVA